MGHPLGTMMLTMNSNNGTFSDKLTRCHTSDLTTRRALRQLWSEECFELRVVHSVRAVRVKDGLPWMMFPLLLRKEGWTDSRLHLSLINLSDGVEKLFDKQEGHCLRISTQVGKWPEEMWSGSQILWPGWSTWCGAGTQDQFCKHPVQSGL